MGTWPGTTEVANAKWITRHPVDNPSLITALRRDLDRGEAESIVLALELGADLIFLDEKDGRHAAKRLGLRVTGTLGILLEAKKKNLITAVCPQVDALRQQAGFYVSDSVYQYVQQLAGE